MSDTLHAPDAGASTAAPAPEALPEEMSEYEMSQHLAEKWHRQRAPQEAAPTPIQAPEADSAPPQEATAETTEADPVEEPLLELPRSWSKEKTQLWETLDRDAKSYLLDHDREVSKSVRQAQNEAAEDRKAAQAARDAAEKARQEYEKALPSLIQTLRTAQAGEFADIKTQDDVNKLAAEDWPRFARWQAHMMQVGTLEQEAKASEERRSAEFKNQWNEFANSEDKKFLDEFPEYSDADKRSKMAEMAIKTAENVGFKRDDLIKSHNGEMTFTARHAAFQALLVKAALYDAAKATAAVVSKKPVPPTQRPGTANPATNAYDQEIATLTKRVAQTGSLKDATALRLAKMRKTAEG